MAKLTPKQRLFVDEYLTCLNATKAALRAGYSERTAAFTGAENLKKPQIQAAIQQAMAERSARVRVDADAVLREIAMVAFSDLRHYVIDDEGFARTAEGAPSSAMRAVSSIKRKVRHYGGTQSPVTEYETEIRLWDKTKALEMAGRHLGMFLDRLAIVGQLSEALCVLRDALTPEEYAKVYDALSIRYGLEESATEPAPLPGE